MSATKDFFVSYTRTDRAWAEWISWTLEQEGYTCVLQAWDFVPGQDFMQQMRNALDQSRQLVAVLSSEYLKSDYAGAELNAALVKDPLGIRGALVPVRVQECELGGVLQGRIYIDLVGKAHEQAKRDLLQGVAAARLGRRPDLEEVRFEQPPRFPGNGSTQREPAVRSASDDTGTTTILFLGVDTGAGLNLRGQAEQIEEGLRESRASGQFRLHPVLDVTTENIFDALNEHRPNIVHFAGKQNGGKVLIRTPLGSVTTISDAALAGLLQSLDSSVTLAIIDTCKSLPCARTVVDVVDFGIGVEGDIHDDDAILFYNVFYRAIAAGRSLASACGQAQAALRFRKVPEAQIPQLCARSAVDPKAHHFARAR